MLAQLNSQLVKQKQDERLSHETLLSYCATAELFANKKLIKYNEYYEHKNNNKTREQLILELAIKLECIRTSYQLFKRDYGYYNFPENLTKDELLNDINGWIINLKKQKDLKDLEDLIQLYENFSNLIKGFSVSKANINQFLQNDKNTENSEENCNDFAFSLMREGKRSEKIMEEVEKNIMETGTSNTHAKLHRINDDMC